MKGQALKGHLEMLLLAVIRDGATYGYAIIEALRQAYEHGAIGEVAIGHLADFVAFTTSLGRLDGRGLVQDPSWREAIEPDYAQFVRPDDDLAPVHGERL